MPGLIMTKDVPHVGNMFFLPWKHHFMCAHFQHSIPANTGGKVSGPPTAHTAVGGQTAADPAIGSSSYRLFKQVCLKPLPKKFYGLWQSRQCAMYTEGGVVRNGNPVHPRQFHGKYQNSCHPAAVMPNHPAGCWSFLGKNSNYVHLSGPLSR